VHGALHPIDPHKRSDERALGTQGPARNPREGASQEVPEPPGARVRGALDVLTRLAETDGECGDGLFELADARGVLGGLAGV
jgi:hypothetical protein